MQRFELTDEYIRQEVAWFEVDVNYLNEQLRYGTLTALGALTTTLYVSVNETLSNSTEAIIAGAGFTAFIAGAICLMANRCSYLLKRYECQQEFRHE